eukprot:278782-Chlamydomonas_euryale.AAC.7
MNQMPFTAPFTAPFKSQCASPAASAVCVTFCIPVRIRHGGIQAVGFAVRRAVWSHVQPQTVVRTSGGLGYIHVPGCPTQSRCSVA